TLPLFSGGRRRAELARARLERRQIAIERDALAERIAQNIRAAMHRLYASYGSIGLSREAASAARSNLDLVTDAYARGAVNVIQLLDAQDQTLEAELGAENALYDFLADALEMQRAAARFDFLESAEEQVMIRRRLEEYLQERRAEADAR
ncbi:MAG: TolC family protein, partial [Pseudomonadota bacterium]